MKKLTIFLLVTLSFRLFSMNEEPTIFVMHSTPILPLPCMEIGGLEMSGFLEDKDASKLTSWTERATLHWAALGCMPDRGTAQKAGERISMPSELDRYKVVLPLSALRNTLIGGTLCAIELETRPEVQNRIRIFAKRVICDLFYVLHILECCLACPRQDVARLTVEYRDKYLRSQDEGKRSIQSLIYDYLGH